MTDEQKDIIEQLERRVATLENMVRRLTFVEALYRVGSFFALAMIALAVAYAYDQKARVAQNV